MNVEEGAATSTPAAGQSAGPNPEYQDVHPDLTGQHFQSTGGPDGAAISIAIMRPGSAPKSNEESQNLEQWRQEMENPPQMLEEGKNDDEGALHRDPIEGPASPQPRKLGTTISGRWEAWLEPITGRTYYYNRTTKETKYSFSAAEIENEEGSSFQAHDERSRYKR